MKRLVIKKRKTVNQGQVFWIGAILMLSGAIITIGNLIIGIIIWGISLLIIYSQKYRLLYKKENKK